MDAASALGSGMEGLARWSLRLFGDFQLTERSGGEKVALPGKRERVLLAYLALSPNGRQPRRKLVTLLWGEAADETTLDNLRTCVFNLRKALGDTERQVIASEDRDIVLDAAAFEIDVPEFRRLAAGSGLAGMEEAAKLYSGDFLEGLSIESDEFESWRREEATRCKGQVLDALTRLMAQLTGLGESERAIEAGLRILRLEPLHEAAVRALMRLYAESGRRATAVELYRTLAEALRKEFGAQPEADTRAVLAEISRGGEERTQAPAAADAVPPPRSPSLARPSDASCATLPPAQHLAPVTSPLQKAKKTRTLNWVLAGGLAAAIAILLYTQFVPSNGPSTGIDSAKAVSSAPAGTIAIAVLPFANLSGDTAQEFFSDGMTDEISSALAKVAGLRVVGRSSAFQFKGQNRDLRTIGQSLGTTHLIDGSVRMAGNRVRITAQLVQADNGIGLWSENYDRELTDVFAIQEDIATAIAGALRVPLGLAQGQSLVSNRTNNVDSYQQYLRAKALVRSRAPKSLTDAAALLEQVVARDPDYAPAWALLAQAYFYMPNFSPAFWSGALDELRPLVDASLPRLEAAARRAIQLDPNLADGYFALGHVQDSRGRLLEAQELLSKGLALDPTNPEILARYGSLLASVGRLKEAVAVRQQTLAQEPFVPIFNAGTALILWEAGETDAAIKMFKDLPAGLGLPDLARAYAAMGNYNEAADSLLAMRPGLFRPGLVEEAARLLRTAPARVASPQSLPRLGTLSFVYLHIGASDRVLEFDEGNVEVGYSVTILAALLWHSSYAEVRKTDRFKAYVRSAGLVEYWRAKGWPEFCRPMGADDFVCE